MSKWLWDRWQALLIIAVCYSIGIVAYIGAGSALIMLNADLVHLSIKDPPAGVIGPDLIANLLTISALTISGCFAYICLPSDRIEVRIATFVEVCLVRQLISKGEFEEFCSVSNAEAMPRSCKVLRGLMAPKSGLGGWYRLTDADLAATFGSSDWKILSRFVDRHLDAKWMVSLSVALAIAMALGGIDLGLRYLGLVLNFYSPFEFAMICVLANLNVGTAYIAVKLAFGGGAVEKKARDRIKTDVDDAKQHIANWQSRKVEAGLTELEDAARTAREAEPELALQAPKAAARTPRKSGTRNG